jgi:hypothetical protein
MILLSVCSIILGAIGPKPTGWVVTALATLALILIVLGGFSVQIGK